MGLQSHKVVFTGKAGTYFGIWIVNLLLTILTIGIYSAWAKVRTQRYLYQNTSIDGRPFDYHATGLQILIGRLIVVAGFVAFSLLSAVPLLGVLLGVGLIFLIPWLFNRSLTFNARVTSFSGLRFNFEGDYWRAFRVYILYPFLSLFTLYLAFPFVARAIRGYVVSGHRFGTARFAFESGIGPFYKAFLLAGVWAVGVALVALAILIPIIGPVEPGAFGPAAEPSPAKLLPGLIPLIILIVAVLPAGFIYQAFIRNAVFAGSTLEGGHAFASDIAPLRLVWIGVTNALAVVASLGLLLPWTRIRMIAYLADHTHIAVNGSLDTFTAAETERVGAIGDAYADIEGIDVGLPV
ncbi:Uncharacterized membrane protein YjgN, DUF898 family [Rhodovulum sp. ES.010]|uniref:YjgN family protein n=1 Tax=Rhodovulum sp. ES.010 TaxID=1882821 RepID=UPI0009288763|nr:YjgN family protein [Rhodovulum sp. ES.010]SIO15898.1 Uncharacterized membrane protein YjgN, DUF898 family [Rhodovulum sp. ES.010]